jgi:hypothetical protein
MRRYRSFAVASSSACAAAVAFSRAAAAADADARACTSANTGSLGTGDAPRDAPESEPLSHRPRGRVVDRHGPRSRCERVCWGRARCDRVCSIALGSLEAFSCARSVVFLSYGVGSGGGGVDSGDASSGGSGGGGGRRACLAREGQVERTRVAALDRHIIGLGETWARLRPIVTRGRSATRYQRMYRVIKTSGTWSGSLFYDRMTCETQSQRRSATVRFGSRTGLYKRCLIRQEKRRLFIPIDV